MFVNGACPPNVIQLKTTNDPGIHPADLRVNLASWSEETGAIISTEEV